MPLNVIGHVFKRGWKIRLAVSPFYFPTMWQAPEIPRSGLHAGPVDGWRPPCSPCPSARRARPEDARVAALLPPRTTYVDPELRATLETLRERLEPARGRAG